MNSEKTHPTEAQIFDLLQFSEYGTTQGDLLRYIERTRRQLDRFECLPEGKDRPFDPAGIARIRSMCDALEAKILDGLTTA